MKISSHSSRGRIRVIDVSARRLQGSELLRDARSVSQSRHQGVNMLNHLLLPALAVLVSLCITGCTDDATRIVSGMRAAARTEFRVKIINETIESAFAHGPSDSSETAWIGAFWGMGLTRYTSRSTDRAIDTAFDACMSRSPEFRRALLEVVCTVYPTRFLPEVHALAAQTAEPKIFAMCAVYIARARGAERCDSLRIVLQERFPDWQGNPILLMLHDDLATRLSGTFRPVPSLQDLLRYRAEDGVPVVFSFQRHDRRYPGMTVVRDGNGRFTRSADGTIFRIPHLALASSNLPGYITNGNTPQGMLSFQGFSHTDNPFIGPTLTVQLVLPFEVSPGTYFRAQLPARSRWHREAYEHLLPGSWREYPPIYEAWHAGRAGRTEIIAHGTTIDPEFYRGEPCYPNTPSLGCMTALELWSPVDGRRMASDQEKLVEVLRSLDPVRAFFCVIEIDDERRPVIWEDVEQTITLVDGGGRQ